MSEKIVPVEPTAKMCDAGLDELGKERSTIWAIYKAMINAAPEPATTVADTTSNELKLPLPKHPSMPNHSISEPATTGPANTVNPAHPVLCRCQSCCDGHTEPVTPDPMTIEGMIASERKRTEPAASKLLLTREQVEQTRRELALFADGCDGVCDQAIAAIELEAKAERLRGELAELRKERG